MKDGMEQDDLLTETEKKEMIENEIRQTIHKFPLEQKLYRHGQYLSLYDLLQLHKKLKQPKMDLNDLSEVLSTKMRIQHCDATLKIDESVSPAPQMVLKVYRPKTTLDYNNEPIFGSFTFIKVENELQLIHTKGNSDELLELMGKILLTTGYDLVKKQYERLLYEHSDAVQNGYSLFSNKMNIFVSPKDISLVITTEEKDYFSKNTIPINSFSLKCTMDEQKDIFQYRVASPDIMRLIENHEIDFLKNIYVKTSTLPIGVREMAEREIASTYENCPIPLKMYQKVLGYFHKER